MSRTFLRQDAQMRQSVTYDDTLAAGATLESGAANIEDDLNGLRSQVEKIIGQGDWWAALAGRNLTTLDTDLTDLEGKKILCRANVLTDVTVPASQNFVILNVAGSEAPTQVAAVATTQDGTVVAQSALSAGAFSAHELIEVAGPDALHPKNLVVIKDATTGNALSSNGQDIFGLMQYESTGVDGAAFNDTSAGNRVKISFVRANAGLDDLEAVPFADIENEVINFSYSFRENLDDMPEDCFLPQHGGFVDQSAAVDVTLDNAIDNQSGLATQTQDIDWDIADGNFLSFTSDAGGTDIFQIVASPPGDYVEFNVLDFDVNNTNAADFAQGVIVDTDDTAINLGVTAGQIDAAAALTITTTGANDMTVASGQELFLDDANQTGSTWAQTGGIKLSETTAEWDDFETKFGEVSLLNAICQAQSSSTRIKGCAEVTSLISADSDAGGVGGGTNLDAQLPDMSAGTFLTSYDVYLNGQLLEGGVDASANNDYYPGTSLANGQLRFEFNLRPGDKICVVCYAA